MYDVSLGPARTNSQKKLNHEEHKGNTRDWNRSLRETFIGFVIELFRSSDGLIPGSE